MKKISDKAITLIKNIAKLWDIYGGLIMSTILSKIVDFSKIAMDNITSYLVLTIVCISTLFFLKKNFIDKLHMTKKINKNNLGEKVVINSQPTIKAIDTAINSEEIGEELGLTLVKTYNIFKKIGGIFMNKVKNFFKWVWLYRQQLIGILGTVSYSILIVYAYIFDKFGWLIDGLNLPQTFACQLTVKIVVGLVSVLFVFYMVRNQIVWRGVGSIEKAQQFLDQLNNGLVNKISPQTKKIILDALSKCKKDLKLANNTLTIVNEKYNKALNELKAQQEFISVISSNGASSDLINTANVKVVELNENFNKVAKEFNNAKESVVKLENQISSYELALK